MTTEAPMTTIMVAIFSLLMKTEAENVNTNKNVGEDMPRSPAHLYKKNIVRAVNLREVLLVKLANGKLAMRLPPITEPLRRILPNGIAVIVEVPAATRYAALAFVATGLTLTAPAWL